MTDLAGSTTAQDLADRMGYDPLFLGPGVPMPAVMTDAVTVLLPYLHYSVLFRPDRHFAAMTALDLDGARLKSLDRADSWQLDPRLAADLQAGPPVYAHNDLDRGHLVMRASSMWGDTDEEVRRAEADTFYFTNAAPQAASFNQGRELWLGLEEYLQVHAATFDRKLAVFAGPVLDPDDPPYRGIQIPLRFWKVVAFVQDGALAATGYILDQTPLVDDLDAVLAAAAAEGAVPPLGEFRTFQVA
jgi:endonuclease G